MSEISDLHAFVNSVVRPLNQGASMGPDRLMTLDREIRDLEGKLALLEQRASIQNTTPEAMNHPAGVWLSQEDYDQLRNRVAELEALWKMEQDRDNHDNLEN